MSRDIWTKTKAITEGCGLTLGPYFAHQAVRQPRHLLFTLSRYKFAARMLPRRQGLRVLELGCNEGLGTLLLAENAQVTAVDFDGDAVAHARQSLAHADAEFLHADFLGQTFGTYDAVVSLDVVEHIAPEREAEYFATLAANLPADGLAVIGTPNDTASPYASEGSRLGHVNLFTAERLAAAMEARFRHVFLFGMNDEVLHTGFYPMCHYLLALGCSPLPGADRP